MRSKSFLALFLAAVLAVAAAAASVYQRQTSHALPATPATLFPGLQGQINEVRKIDVVLPEGTFTIEKREGDAWAMVEKGGYPVLYETVKQAVVGLAGMRPLEAKTARPELYPKIKVVDPREEADMLAKGTLIRLTGEEGKEIAALVVGKTRSIQTSGRVGWYYVRKPAEARSWLVSARLEVFDKANAWLDGETVRIDRKRVRAAGNRQADGALVEVSRPSPDEIDFKVDNVPEGSEMIHETVANSLGSALGFLSFEDVKPATELDFEAAVVARFTTFDGLVVSVEVIEVAGKQWARFQARFDAGEARLDAVPEKHREKMKSAEEVEKEAAWINQRFAAWAYNLPKYKADDFTTKMEKLVVVKKPKDES